MQTPQEKVNQILNHPQQKLLKRAITDIVITHVNKTTMLGGAAKQEFVLEQVRMIQKAAFFAHNMQPGSPWPPSFYNELAAMWDCVKTYPTVMPPVIASLFAFSENADKKTVTKAMNGEYHAKEAMDKFKLMCEELHSVNQKRFN